MDGERFDQLTRTLAQGVSRRRVLQGMAATAAVLGTAVGRSAQSAPSSCSVFCAGLPGPQKAACKQACRECGGDPSLVCIGFGPLGPSSFVCCPEGTVCDPFTGECVEVTTCPTGEPAENCALGIITNCRENEACALVDDVDNGCFCIERICGTPCTSSADCGGGTCVEVPGCCPDVRFCATPCGTGGTSITTAGWR